MVQHLAQVAPLVGILQQQLPRAAARMAGLEQFGLQATLWRFACRFCRRAPAGAVAAVIAAAAAIRVVRRARASGPAALTRLGALAMLPLPGILVLNIDTSAL